MLHARAEQIQQQAIAVVQVVLLLGVDGVLQQGDAGQAQLGGQRGGLAHVIGLDGPGGDQRIGLLSQCVGTQVFQLACLVAAEGEQGQVIAFDVDFAPHMVRQAQQVLQRGGMGNQFQALETAQGFADHVHQSAIEVLSL